MNQEGTNDQFNRGEIEKLWPSKDTIKQIIRNFRLQNFVRHVDNKT